MTHPSGPAGTGPSGGAGTSPRRPRLPRRPRTLVRTVGDYAAISYAIARMTGLLLAEVVSDTLARRRFRKAGGAR